MHILSVFLLNRFKSVANISEKLKNNKNFFINNTKTTGEETLYVYSKSSSINLYILEEEEKWKKI